MTRRIIALHKDVKPKAFIREAVQAGVKLQRIGGLRRHFYVGAEDAEKLPRWFIAHDDPEDNEPISRGADQAMTLGATLSEGPWALARIIRRKAPWNVDRMRHPIDTFFRAARDGSGTRLYWIDTGIKTTHDEFGGRATIKYGNADTYGHGTRQSANAAGGTLGAARGASLWSYNIESSPGSGTASSSTLITALSHVATDYASETLPAVANCSFSPTFSSTAAAAVDDLMDDGLVFCWSAGNDGVELNSTTNPVAYLADMIVSGGMSAADLPMNVALNVTTPVLTNYGDEVDIMSPGAFIRCAGIASDSDYFLGSGGTSAGSAFTAGVVACMLQGRTKFTTRAEVTSFHAELLAAATTGKFRNGGLNLPDRILYLDPDDTP